MSVCTACSGLGANDRIASVKKREVVRMETSWLVRKGIDSYRISARGTGTKDTCSHQRFIRLPLQLVRPLCIPLTILLLVLGVLLMMVESDSPKSLACGRLYAMEGKL